MLQESKQIWPPIPFKSYRVINSKNPPKISYQVLRYIKSAKNAEAMLLLKISLENMAQIDHNTIISWPRNKGKFLT